MKRKYVTRLAMAGAFAAAIGLTAMGAPAAAQQDEKPDMEHPGMPMPMEEGGMMAMHAKMQAMDQDLDALVVEMNSAGVEQKPDAIAAVVTELVNQRKLMHGMMMKMGPQMMGHMMEHMRSGMIEGMKMSMGECPMMQQMSPQDEEAEEDDHSAHHPEG